jgi:hypothetical protein
MPGWMRVIANWNPISYITSVSRQRAPYHAPA